MKRKLTDFYNPQPAKHQKHQRRDSRNYRNGIDRNHNPNNGGILGTNYDGWRCDHELHWNLLLERLPSSPIMIDWTCLTTCLCPAMISIGLIKTGQAKEGSKTVSQERTFRSVQISNVFSGKGGTVLPLLCIICRTKQRTKVWISCYQAIYKLRSDVSDHKEQLTTIQPQTTTDVRL